MTDQSPTINLSGLLRSPGETSIQGELDLLRYEQAGEEQTITFVEPAPYRVSVNTLGGDELWLSGRFQPTLEMECARCLRPVAVPLDLKLGTLVRYRPSVEVPHVEALDTGEDILVFGDPNLDLSDYLAENTIVEAPLSVLHDPDCKGLCQVCGQDLNEGTCEHQAAVPIVDLPAEENAPARDNSPFAALRGLDLPED